MSRHETIEAISLLDEPERRRLYDWVASAHRRVGREEAAKALGMTRALAAFHLDKLADAGLLETGYARLSGKVGPGAGRPARVYWRADRDFSVSVPGREYVRAAELFASALEEMGGASVPKPLRAAAGELGEQLGRGARPRAARRRLLAALEAGGYEPQSDELGTIRLRNCPFHALVQEHRPLVCGTNLALAEGITRGAGATDVRPVLDPQAGYCCVAFVPDARPARSDRLEPDPSREAKGD